LLLANYKSRQLANTSYYLCDDVVLCHAFPNLVHCTVDWGKRESISHKAVGAAVITFFTHRENQSQPSTFDIEINKGGEELVR